ncbi:MAG: site-specific integrase [Candidatus Bathyarchaeia archaeon]
MINRNNYLLALEFFDYLALEKGLCDKSVRLKDTWVRHFLDFLGDVSLMSLKRNSESKFIDLVGSFAQYLTAYLKPNGYSLSREYKRKILEAEKQFLTWLRDEQGYKIPTKAFNIIKIHQKKLIHDGTIKDYVSYEEIITIVKLPTESLKEKRTVFVMTFLYLSGMRVDTLVSLPLSAVDLDKRVVHQDPDRGVHTKNNNSGTTYLLEIPELLEFVYGWRGLVQAAYPSDALWFAPLTSTGEFNTCVTSYNENRASVLRRDMKEFAQKHNLKYYSPHCYRRGHAIYLYRGIKSYSDVTIIQKNLMHKNLLTTIIYLQHLVPQLGLRIRDITPDKLSPL